MANRAEAEPQRGLLENSTPSLAIAQPTTASDLEPAAAPVHLDDHRRLGELGELVLEHGCVRTLATGLGSGESAVAIASAHARRGEGLHISIDPTLETAEDCEPLRALRGRDLEPCVRLLGRPPELALPELLAEGTQIDLALIEGPKRFEDAYLELLYLDRLLLTGGLLAISGLRQPEVIALKDYLTQARAYECRSPAGAALTVLRKLGSHRPPDTPVPATWRSAAQTDAAPGTAIPRGGFAWSPASGAAQKGAASREIYLSEAWAAELEARAHALGARLVEAEAEAARELSDLRRQLEEAKTARAQAEYWLTCMRSSPSWRLTEPLRSLKKHRRAWAKR